MHAVELSEVDLNLLVVLAVLLDEGGVTRAAARLGRTQSAVSHALDRLRDVFHDPLFVRAGQRLVPTPRAEALREPVRDLTARLHDLMLGARPFDAARSDRRFTITASDYLQAVLVPALVRRLRAAAPLASLAVLGPKRRLPERLARGEVDFALLVQLDESSSLYAQKLFTDRFVCLVAADHPVARRGLDRAAYLRLPHAFIAPLGRTGGHVDRELSRTGEARHIAVLVPDFMIAPRTLLGTDLVLTLPERVARLFHGEELKMLEPPLDLPPIHGHLVWHERLSEDGGARWFRALVEATAKELDGKGEEGPRRGVKR